MRILYPMHVTESSILFQNHIKRVKIEFQFMPEIHATTPFYLSWNTLVKLKHLEYDRKSELHFEKFTLCKL